MFNRKQAATRINLKPASIREWIAEIDFRIQAFSEWIQEDEKRAIIAILSATTSIFFVWGLYMLYSMPLPNNCQ